MNPTLQISPEALNYIQTEMSRGVSEQSIRQQFQAQAWPAESVEAAFLHARAMPVTVQTNLTVDSPAAFAGLPESLIPQTTTATAKHPATARYNARLADSLMHGVFRGGFAFIFLINGFIAWVRPAEFIRLLESFPIASMIGYIPQMVMFTGLHDIILGLLILSGKWRIYVWAWAGIWLSLVTVIKLVSLL